MKLILNTMFFIAISISFNSCDNHSITSKTESLLPIKEGNTWEYKKFKGNGSEEINSYQTIIGEKVKIKGETGYLINPNTRPFNAQMFGRNTSEGHFMSVGGYSQTDTLINPSVQFKANALKGETWVFNNTIFSNETGQFETRENLMKCISPDTIITAMNKEFHCMAFEYSPNNGEDLFQYFLAKNIGIIKTVHFEDNKLQSTSMLIDYLLFK